jgi:hypothetical protein
MTTCVVSFNIGVQNYNKGFIREKAFKISFRTSNGQILNEAQEDHKCSNLYIYKCPSGTPIKKQNWKGLQT